MLRIKAPSIEIRLILTGVLFVALLAIGSHFITQNAQEKNFYYFQSVIKDNLEKQYLLLQMSNVVRDRMLLVYDINQSTDAFDIDDYTQNYREIVIFFIQAREKLLQSNLSSNQKTRLNELRAYLINSGRILDAVVDKKTINNEHILILKLQNAREINIVILDRLQILIDEQSTLATTKLEEVRTSNKEVNAFVNVIHISALLLSIIIVIYIINLLNKRKNELNHLLEQLEDKNENLKTTVITKTEDLTLLQAEHSRINAKLEVSKELQKIILPPAHELNVITALDIATYVEPAEEEVGGDYLDVLPLKDGYLICIGDVTDHGLESNILMLMVQSMLRHQSNMPNMCLKQALIDINLSVFQNLTRIKSDRHLSLSLAHYHNGLMTITGQHETIIIIRNNGDLETHSTNYLGFPIGLIDDISEFTDSIDIKLELNDLVLFYTDGVTEAANHNEELYGFKRLCQITQKNKDLASHHIVQNIIKDINIFTENKPLYDDIALIVFKQL